MAEGVGRAVLFVGRLSAPKGVYDLFDAIPYVIERHPEAHFVLPCITFLGSLEGRNKAAQAMGSGIAVF